MKKLLFIFVLLLASLSVIGCGNKENKNTPTVEPTIEPTVEPTVEPTSEPTAEPSHTATMEDLIAQIEFKSITFLYDGKVHSLEAKNLPAGVTVRYENNDQTEKGDYVVKAIFTYDGKDIGEKTAHLIISAGKTADDLPWV